MLIQSKARQSAGSHLVVACCSWLPLLISSAPGRAGDRLLSRTSTPPCSEDQPCGELSGKAAQALLTNLSHQSHSLLQPAPNIQSLPPLHSALRTADFFQNSWEVHGNLPDSCELWSTFSAPRMSPDPAIQLIFPTCLYFSLHPCLVPGALESCVLHTTKGLQPLLSLADGDMEALHPHIHRAS